MGAPVPAWSRPEVRAVEIHGQRSRWSDLCQLALPPQSAETGATWDRWQLELGTDDGRSVLRQVIRDPGVLHGRKRLVDLELHRLTGDDPRQFILNRRRSDESWAEPITGPVPAAFRRRYRDLLTWVMSLEVPPRSVSFCPVGGLANQLFQAGAMLGCARRHGVPWVCAAWKTSSPSMIAPRPTYWDSIFPAFVGRAEGVRPDPRSQHNYADPTFTYTPIPMRHDHQALWGHFLSYKYFEAERPELLDLLYSHQPLQDEVDQAFHRIRESLPGPPGPIVSVHVRRGDSLLNPTLTRMSMAYYDEAMARFRSDLPGCRFAIFSDDIPWCRESFTREDVTFVEGNRDTVDLFLMARCQHHVIANSTYSWWGAYLNRDLARRVIYPTPWFAGIKRRRDMSDFFLPDWQALPVRDP